MSTALAEYLQVSLSFYVSTYVYLPTYLSIHLSVGCQSESLQSDSSSEAESRRFILTTRRHFLHVFGFGETSDM